MSPSAGTAPPALPLADGRILALGERTYVMGIVNVTPDSFSDGGSFFDADAAIAHGLEMAADGADILDVGGESTRPGADPVDAAEEIRRTRDVVAALATRSGAVVSIDTTKAAVAEAALDAGALIVNDVSAGRFDPRMLDVAAEARAAVVLMHMQGEPRTMQQSPQYTDVVAEVRAFLEQRAGEALVRGIPAERIVVDPGIGFGKTLAHNLTLIARLDRITELGFAVVSGTSRKSFIGRVLDGAAPEDRLEGTAATVALSIARGATIVRVHDVRAMVRVTRMSDAVLRAGARDATHAR